MLPLQGFNANVLIKSACVQPNGYRVTITIPLVSEDLTSLFCVITLKNSWFTEDLSDCTVNLMFLWAKVAPYLYIVPWIPRGYNPRIWIRFVIGVDKLRFDKRFYQSVLQTNAGA
jgi:hypothetical protein